MGNKHTTDTDTVRVFWLSEVACEGNGTLAGQKRPTLGPGLALLPVPESGHVTVPRP